MLRPLVTAAVRLDFLSLYTMAYKLFDYVDAQGRNVVEERLFILQKPQRAKLNQLLDKLVKHGDGLYPRC